MEDTFRSSAMTKIMVAMFDICKNNQRVAQLHLTKTAYRLGEPVTGVLDFEHATMSTYQVSLFRKKKIGDELQNDSGILHITRFPFCWRALK